MTQQERIDRLIRTIPNSMDGYTIVADKINGKTFALVKIIGDNPCGHIPKGCFSSFKETKSFLMGMQAMFHLIKNKTIKP